MRPDWGYCPKCCVQTDYLKTETALVCKHCHTVIKPDDTRVKLAVDSDRRASMLANLQS